MTRVLPPRFPLLLSIVLAATLPACRPGDGATAEAETPLANEPAPPPLVRVATIELRPVRRTIETTSYLESEHRVTVQSKIAGRVDKVLGDEGQSVDKGQVLARLDDREARSSFLQAEIQLADRRVRFQLAELEAQAAVQRIEQARIERDKTKSQHQRNLEIDPGLIAEKELEESRYALETAEEALLVSGVLRQKADLEVLAAKNTIAELEAKVESERLRLSEHEILAPLEGVVAERMIRGGETISAATDLFVVVDQVNLISHLRRPQRELATVRGAREVTFTTDAVPDHEFRAAIDVISPVIDETTGSFRIRIRVHRDDDVTDVLRPGMFIRAVILAEDEREALMVPKAAVLNEGAQSVVFVVRDGVARRVVLIQGIEERDFVECRNRGDNGLARGDEVIVSGQQSLSDATAVDISRD